jgi:hypothetical protein
MFKKTIIYFKKQTGEEKLKLQYMHSSYKGNQFTGYFYGPRKRKKKTNSADLSKTIRNILKNVPNNHRWF